MDEGLTERRAGSGRLLHQELAAVASSLVGVDLSHAGLEQLARIVPGEYVQGDVESLSVLPLPTGCDLVIAAELIEHVPNPGRFLAELREYLARTGATALLTTPNAYAWGGFARYAMRRREHVHPDHCMLFSPTTLARLVRSMGLQIESHDVHVWHRPGFGVRRLLDAAVLRWNPWLAPGLVMEVSVRADLR